METEALRWFQQVADGVTVTEVSELERVSQPGVSRALQRLEAEVGAPLLYKSGRTLRLTHAGSVFKRHADALLHQLDDGRAAVSELLDPGTGTVALAFQQSLGTWLAPELVRGFRAGQPRIRFRLTQVRDELHEPALAGGDADLELGSRRRRAAGLRTQLLGLEPLRLALPREHPLAGQAALTLADVAGEPFVSTGPDSALRAQTDELCREAGFVPEVVFEGDDETTVRGFVAAGLGVAILPAERSAGLSGGPGDGGPVRYRTVPGGHAVREIWLTWSAERRLLPAAGLFRAHVLDAAPRVLGPAAQARK